jgi:hypothetical protein
MTRSLQPNEKLTLGQAVLFFDKEPYWGSDWVRPAPASHEEAVKGVWFTGRVTDLSDLFKGIVHVSNGRRAIKIGDIRVVTSGGIDGVATDK